MWDSSGEDSLLPPSISGPREQAALGGRVNVCVCVCVCVFSLGDLLQQKFLDLVVSYCRHLGREATQQDLQTLSYLARCGRWIVGVYCNTIQ